MLEDADIIEPIYVELGRRVLQERYRAGWTQQDVAGQVGMSRASIANVETGRQRLMLHQVMKLAEVFSIRVEDLLGVALNELPASKIIDAVRKENVALRSRVADMESALRAIAERAARSID